MGETQFQHLSVEERRLALRAAQAEGAHPAFLLEKDIWLLRPSTSCSRLRSDGIWCSRAAHRCPRSGGRYGGSPKTSTSRTTFAALLRTWLRAATRRLWPPTRSQERRWTKAIRARLAEWVRERASTLIEDELTRAGFVPRIRTEAERLYIRYDPLFETRGIVRPEVQVDFGARWTGQPHAVHTVACDAAAGVPDLVFPEARPAAMLPERTFWEKATSMHVYCLQGRVRGERWSRHWHDLVRLDNTGIAARTLANRELALSVARHKAMFFRKNDSGGRRIDYEAAVSGNLRLVPSGAAEEALAEDYASMLAIGMLLDEDEPFGTLTQRCALIEERANAAQATDL